jgi:citrate synthase
MNTASTTSAITFLDGEKGILRYRGYPIEQLGEKSTFVEVAYLLIYGKLPTEELDRFTKKLTRHSLIHEDMKRFFDGYPSTAHPMAILSAMVCSLSSYYPDALDVRTGEHRHDDRAPARQGADHRGVLVQEVDRPAVRLPAELARLRVELPQHDVQRCRRSRTRSIPTSRRR